MSVDARAQFNLSGRVVDGQTGEPLPYVNLKLMGVPSGTITDFDGFFSIVVPPAADSIIVSYVGYKKERLLVSSKQPNMQITLYPDADEIEAVLVKPGVNPALVIMNKVRKNKKLYNPEKLEYYEYESYNKVQLAVDNVTEKFKERRIFKAVEPLFDTVSAFTDTNSNKVLPVFVSESLTDYYYRKNPRRTKEMIKATRVKGVGVGEESYVAQLLGNTFQQYNFYENNLYILDKDFISPLSFQAKSYYYFWLIDSMQVDGEKTYKIQVSPKNPKDLVFHGFVWITDGKFALKRLALEITQEANLNFIEILKIQQEFEEVSPNDWLPSRTRVLIDIAEMTGNTAGMIGLYYNSNRNIIVNKARPLSFYEEKIKVLDEAYNKGDVFWDTARHEKINATDERIYQMVDSLKNQPLVRTYVDIIETVVEGHLPVGKVELGPYHYLLGFNNLEGFRTRVGFRTSPAFHKDAMLAVYGAYGLRDERFKYGFKADYLLNRTKWLKVGLEVKDDIELIGVTDQDYGTSALFDAFSTFGTDQLNRGVSQRLWVEKELFKGFTATLNVGHKAYHFYQIGDFDFQYRLQPDLADESPVASNFNVSTVSIRGRLSHKELFVIRRNKRYSLGNLKAPVLTLDYSRSFRGVLDSDFEYDKVGLQLWQFNSLGNLGTFEYTVKAGKVFGNVPYPLLYVVRGNQSILSSRDAYNLMNFFEFAADQFVSAHYEHQFNGIIMNRIPLVKKWKLRSFVNAKSVYGTMSTANLQLMPTEIPGITLVNQFDNKPYVELGYGIENILKFIRVDFIHRVTYLYHENARPFGVKVNAVFRF